MILLKLYRYVFDWNTLSSQERGEAPVQLKPFIDKPIFRSALQALKATPLSETLYSGETRSGYYYVSSDENIKKWFAIYNDRYHYFDKTDNEEQFVFLYRLFELFNRCISDKDGLFDTKVTECCYKVLVFFGSNTISETLTHLEQYCQDNQWLSDNKLFERLLTFQLSDSVENQTIHLPAWRKVVRSMDLAQGLKLFRIAKEIETTLGHAPTTVDEATSAAKRRRFKWYLECPQYAQFCSEHYIPEQLFNESLRTETERVIYASLAIIKQLPFNALDEYIQLMPKLVFDCYQIGKLLDALPANQEAVINHFSDVIELGIKKTSQLTSLLSHIHTATAQKALIKLLSCERTQYLMNRPMYELECLLKSVHRDYQQEFIDQVLGKKRIQATIQSNYDLCNFMSTALPQKNQGEFLREIIGVEKIRAVISNHAQVIEQLKQLHDDEKLAYLREVVGKEKLNAVLVCNWYMLEAVLEIMPQKTRFSVLFDIVGVDNLRQIIQFYGDLRGQNTIIRLLPKEQQALFLEQLLPEEEKKAKAHLLATKELIKTHSFSLGFMGSGYGGEEIILDNGSKKKVPKTVKTQWMWIQEGERGAMAYTEAWQEVQKLGVEAKSSMWSPHYFSQTNDTLAYYQAFAKSEKTMTPRNG